MASIEGADKAQVRPDAGVPAEYLAAERDPAPAGVRHGLASAILMSGYRLFKA
jgi:hypothetical protein